MLDAMGWKDADWRRMQELRTLFLERRTGDSARGYWRTARDLELYDAFFAQRIGWKWDAVLHELARRGWQPPELPVCDFGCGTGIAARTFARTFGAPASGIELWDASGLARRFARERLTEEFSGLKVRALEHAPREASVLLISHVLNELDQTARAGVLELARRATVVMWVEAGDRETSRALCEVREDMRSAFRVIAPCPHQATCGALAGESDWCHHFARPPRSVFQDGDWTHFSHALRVDLRSLPYSFLVLDRRAAAESDLRPTRTRLIGRPRIEKGRALVHACRSSGTETLILPQRLDKRLFKSLSDCAGRVLEFDVESQNGRIERIEEARLT